jgi:predicted  nucleic acid-binding Zn-ribbon protein
VEDVEEEMSWGDVEGREQKLSKIKLRYMAQKKTSEVDYSMQEKIMALYELQKIDSQVDEINKVKGELPLEVEDLEDEIAGLNTRIENINAEIEEFNTLTKQRKREIDQAKIQISHYKEQQNNVRNNREFDAITKEIEYQELEIELAEKRLKEYTVAVKNKKAQLEEAEAAAAERNVDLAAKRAELESIEAETADQVAALQVKADKAKSKIDERLLTAYNRIRRSVRNGLAVVTVKRDACGGCFNRIPPQRQADVRVGKKLIVCEYCGRILVADNEE